MNNTLKRKKDFQRVFKKGKRVSSYSVNMVYKKTINCPKISAVAAKRLGCAVLRNRCKRLLREAAFLNQAGDYQADIIFLANKHTYDATIDQIVCDMKTLLQRIPR